MADPPGLSKAQVLLLGIHFASLTNLNNLQCLCQLRPDVLDPTLVLRILLTYLPETVEPNRYIGLILSAEKRLLNTEGTAVEDGGDVVDTESLDTSPVRDIDHKRASKLAKRAALLPIEPTQIDSVPPKKYEDLRKEEDRDLELENLEVVKIRHLISCFLVHRARRIESQTGLLINLPQLLEPFLGYTRWLKVWYVSRVVPLIRWNYEIQPVENPIPLEVFEQMDRMSVLGTFLEHGEGENLPLKIKMLVGPWLYGFIEKSDAETKTSAWTPVYEWIFYLSSRDFSSVVDLIEKWDGPGDIDGDGFTNDLDETLQQRFESGYAQSAIAAIYASTDNTPATIAGVHKIISRIAGLLDLDPPQDIQSSLKALPIMNNPFSTSANISPSDLSPTDILRRHNPLTTPTPHLFSFLQAVFLSFGLLARYGTGHSFSQVVQLYLFSSENEQKQSLHQALSGAVSSTAKSQDWDLTRSQVTWLWGWGADQFGEDQFDSENSQMNGYGIFARISKTDFECEFMKSLLNAGKYTEAKKIYIQSKTRPLPKETIEKIIVETALGSYDNATNGNRTRGGIKKASDIIAIVYPSVLPKSVSLTEITHLITATHALSFYSLTLQYNVPFKPVNIRAHSDPLSLIQKVLEQNSRSYAKIDDLISITLNLIGAGLIKHNDEDIKPSRDTLQKDAERRVMSMAIEAALNEDDFGTAYSYIVNRLLPASSEDSSADDVSWRAAFQAGKHRSLQQSGSSISSATANLSNVTSNSNIRALEMRLELLSRALLLAPPVALPEILAKWRQGEEELNSLIDAQSDEFDGTPPPWTAKQPHAGLPGEFEPDDQELDREAEAHLKRGRGGLRNYREGEDEAPMGLFEVASSAAKAIRKTAFPLSGTEASNNSTQSSGRWSGTWSTEDKDTQDGQRARTRDVVSSRITGGLASGIGWVLGAQPARDPNSH
jgi:hypothetical protein